MLVAGQEGWRRGHEGAGETLEIAKLVLPSSSPGQRQVRLPGKRGSAPYCSPALAVATPLPWLRPLLRPRPSLQPEFPLPQAPSSSAFMASPHNSLGVLFLTPPAGVQLFLTVLWSVLWSAVKVSVALTSPPL